MTLLHRLGSVVRWVLRRNRAEQELDDELRTFIDMAAAAKMREGVSPEEARRQARLDLGGLEQVKERVRTSRHGAWLDALGQDLRYALRITRRAPGFTVVTVLTLALGIGANAAVFGFLDMTVLQPVPVHDPEHLLALAWTAGKPAARQASMNNEDCFFAATPPASSGCTFSWPVFQRLQESAAFSSLAAFAGPAELPVSGNGATALASGYFVSGSFFETLGVAAAMGRTITGADDNSGANPVVVLSDGFWRRSFGVDPEVIGRTVHVGGVAFTVIGVTRSDFTRLSPGFAQDFWIPLAITPRLGLPWLPESIADEGFWWLEVVGRLRPGTSVPPAAVVAPMLDGRWGPAGKPTFPPDARPSISVLPVSQALMGLRKEFSKPTLILMCAVGLVLLTACANIAGLLLARNATRSRELAIRRALGAGRSRIARQLLTESLVLSLAGGAVGIGVAIVGSRLLVAFLETGPFGPTGFEAALSLRILMFVLGASVATGLLFGAAPAWRSMRDDLNPALKQIDGGLVAPSGQRLTGAWRLRQGVPGHLLVIAQVVASMVFLVLGGLLLRTLVNLQRVNPGFDTGNVLLFGINPVSSGYAPQRTLLLLPELKRRLETMPGVSSVTYSSSALLGGSVSRTNIDLPGDANRALSVDMMDIGLDYFETMGIPLVAGHDFLETDFRPRSGVVVVNREFIRRFFGKDDDAGQQLGRYPRVLDREIVGIVGDVKGTTLRGEAAPTIYRPLVLTLGTVRYAMRTVGHPLSIAAGVRQMTTELGPNLPILDLQTQEETIDRLLFRERLYARVGSLFSISAALLVGIGLHGLLAFGVAQRRREIGIRLALGALPNGVLRMVVGDGLALMAIGILIGAALALAIARLFSSVMFGVDTSDPISIGLSILFLLIVSTAASLLPALRASRVDPIVALRHE